MLDIPALFQRFSIRPIGAIHVGAYYGFEDNLYKLMNFQSLVYIEAHPLIFRHLQQRVARPGVYCENFVITDKVGETPFHVTVNGMASSVLPLKKHKIAYPDIEEFETVTLPTTTVDEIAAKYGHLEFNFLNMDIQGGELQALRGALRTLPRLDAMILEFQLDELYEGVPHVRDLDRFLEPHGFTRVDSVTGDRSWGDGFYVRDALTRY